MALWVKCFCFPYVNKVLARLEPSFKRMLDTISEASDPPGSSAAQRRKC